MDAANVHGRIAFVEKVFLKRHPAQAHLRGVELFNLNLVRELAENGRQVYFAAEKSWREILERYFGSDNPNIAPIYSPALPHPFLNAVWTAVALARIARREGAFDNLLIGNVGNGLIPAIRLLRRAGAFRRMVLIAHRETSAKFLRAIADIPGHVVSVCGPIARPFSESGIIAESHVDYGILNADKFFPRSELRTSNLGTDPKKTGSVPISCANYSCQKTGSVPVPKVKFCVVGALDNAWKGADTAIAAFRLLPDSVRAGCELHLMAYERPQDEHPEDGITAYAWREADALPPFLRGMDVMIVPSRDEEVMRETFSQATVQGMLTALPIIHSDLPILNEKFDAGGGIQFKDVQSLADAMVHLAADPRLRARLGSEARATALARYVWDTRRFCVRYL